MFITAVCVVFLSKHFFNKTVNCYCKLYAVLSVSFARLYANEKIRLEKDSTP